MGHGMWAVLTIFFYSAKKPNWGGPFGRANWAVGGGGFHFCGIYRRRRRRRTDRRSGGAVEAAAAGRGGGGGMEMDYANKHILAPMVRVVSFPFLRRRYGELAPFSSSQRFPLS